MAKKRNRITNPEPSPFLTADDSKCSKSQSHYHHHFTVMASSSSLFFTLSLLFTLTLPLTPQGEKLYEHGYTVSTVIEGDKLHVNPQSILPQYGSSDLILLDSAASTFYTLSFSSPPQESVIKRLAGNGVAGCEDGDLGSASFNKPKSFAVDFKGNIYVADKNNHAIRIITPSGVATIAGGYTQKPGHTDGPAQNATFSDDFELVFAPQLCALIISDHGNRLVRQINLNAVNCIQASENVLGTTSAWVVGLLVSCLLGLAIGFLIRPYVAIPQGGQGHCRCKETWNHFLINLGRRAPTIYFDTKSAVVSSAPYSLLRTLVMLTFSHLALMFSRFRVVVVVGSQTTSEELVSLLDFDHVRNTNMTKPTTVADQLNDLITCHENLLFSDNADIIVGQDEGSDVIFHRRNNEKIDDIIEANIIDFALQATRPSHAESSSVCSLG